MNISHNQRKFRNIAEQRGRLYRRNRVNSAFAVMTNRNKLALLKIIESGPGKLLTITDRTRQMNHLIGKDSDLYDRDRYEGPGGFNVVFHEEECDDVYNWVLDAIDGDRVRPPIDMFEPLERVEGLPAYLWTSIALRYKSDLEYRRNKKARGKL